MPRLAMQLCNRATFRICKYWGHANVQWHYSGNAGVGAQPSAHLGPYASLALACCRFRPAGYDDPTRRQPRHSTIHHTPAACPHLSPSLRTFPILSRPFPPTTRAHAVPTAQPARLLRVLPLWPQPLPPPRPQVSPPPLLPQRHPTRAPLPRPRRAAVHSLTSVPAPGLPGRPFPRRARERGQRARPSGAVRGQGRGAAGAGSGRGGSSGPVRPSREVGLRSRRISTIFRVLAVNRACVGLVCSCLPCRPSTK